MLTVDELEKEVRFWVFRNAFSSMSLQTRSCSHIIQNLPCGVTENSSEAFRAHSPLFVAGFRAESSPSSSTRAHTNTQTHARAHTYVRRRAGDRREFNYSGSLTFLLVLLTKKCLAIRNAMEQFSFWSYNLFSNQIFYGV